jgi:hypothetical protein
MERHRSCRSRAARQWHVKSPLQSIQPCMHASVTSSCPEILCPPFLYIATKQMGAYTSGRDAFRCASMSSACLRCSVITTCLFITFFITFCFLFHLLFIFCVAWSFLSRPPETPIGTIIGFNLGDELVWNCIPSADVATAAATVRADFPRGSALIW